MKQIVFITAALILSVGVVRADPMFIRNETGRYVDIWTREGRARAYVHRLGLNDGQGRRIDVTYPLLIAISQSRGSYTYGGPFELGNAPRNGPELVLNERTVVQTKSRIVRVWDARQRTWIDRLETVEERVVIADIQVRGLKKHGFNLAVEYPRASESEASAAASDDIPVAPPAPPGD